MDKEVIIRSDGTTRAYIPVGDEKMYFEDSSTRPNFGIKAMIRVEKCLEVQVWMIDTLRDADVFH